MSSPVVNSETRPGSRQDVDGLEWTFDPELSAPIGFAFEVRLVPDPQGGYSAYLPALPGVVSEGDDEDSALENILEAARLSLRAYRDAGLDIPWLSHAPDLEPAEKSFRVAVNV